MIEVYFKQWDLNNLYGGPVSQKVPVNDFKWVEQTSAFNDNFVKSYNDERSEGYFLELDFQLYFRDMFRKLQMKTNYLRNDQFLFLFQTFGNLCQEFCLQHYASVFNKISIR